MDIRDEEIEFFLRLGRQSKKAGNPLIRLPAQDRLPYDVSVGAFLRHEQRQAFHLKSDEKNYGIPYFGLVSYRSFFYFCIFI
ncbi:hypothetical protein EZS27_017657 [termite gut metagenome]|uniref:Uncharacterized protein n=1 Tax=termite gut metagenome TaxID=433724 RepID=A0A5J4RMA0_9ZZZZ